MGNRLCRLCHCILFVLLAVISLGAFGIVQAKAEESHPGMNAEALYSEAVLALSRKQIQEAMKVLDELLLQYPKYAEALELKALTLKNEGHDLDAIATYQKLLELKPAQERGPYHFELGMIYQRQKNDKLAQHHFEMSLRLRFNATVCRFFLGILEFAHNQYRHAEYYFRRVTHEDKGELKLVSHYYLGLLELKSGFPLGATRDLTEARNLAATLPESPSAQGIMASADQVLAPFHQAQWFANISTLGQYDSNISEVPTSLASAGQSSGMRTAKTTFSAGFGRMGPPLSDLQMVWNYRLNLNKNFNAETRTYEFVTNSASVYLNYLPLNPTQGGFKLEGNLMFQNQVQDGGQATDPQARFSYGKYNVSAELGPFFRYQPTRQIQTELDVYVRPQTFYTESGLSGTTVFSRLSARVDLYQRFLNPSASISYENYGANGIEFKSNTMGLGLANLLKVSPADQLTVSFDFLSTHYPQSLESRADKNYAFRANLLHTFSPRWALLADLGYTQNHSSVSDTYTYNRWNSSLGVSWSL